MKHIERLIMKEIRKPLEALEKERHPEICGGWETMRIDRAIDIVRNAGKDGAE